MDNGDGTLTDTEGRGFRVTLATRETHGGGQVPFYQFTAGFSMEISATVLNAPTSGVWGFSDAIATAEVTGVGLIAVLGGTGPATVNLSNGGSYYCDGQLTALGLCTAESSDLPEQIVFGEPMYYTLTGRLNMNLGAVSKSSSVRMNAGGPFAQYALVNGEHVPITFELSDVPEPNSYLLVGLSLALMLGYGYSARRRKSTTTRLEPNGAQTNREAS